MWIKPGKIRPGEHEVIVTDYSGDIDAIEISAVKPKFDKLLETLVVIANCLSSKPTQAPVEAVVIKS